MPTAPTPCVISIQSQVAVGHVGNSAAVLPMQVMGVDVVPVPTTLLSNHPHYPTLRGAALGADQVADLLQGVIEREVPQRAQAIVSGYLGRAETASVVASFVERAKTANPALRYVCDPVMGDSDLGFFVPEALRAAFRERLLPLADVITPNQFELEFLIGGTIDSVDAFRRHADTLRSQGLDIVVMTGGELGDTPAGWLDVCVVHADGGCRVRTPRLAFRPVGTGDVFTGLLTAALVRGAGPEAAAIHAMDGIFAVLKATLEADAPELRLVENMASLSSPLRVCEILPF